MKPIALLLSLTCCATGCASLQKDVTVCPEYRTIRCVTAPECSYDRKLGCKVCRCSPVGADSRGTFRSNLAPDQPLSK